MRQRWLFALVLLVAGAVGAHAQEHVERADTTACRPKPFPVMGAPLFADPFQALYLSGMPEMPESKEERAARINRETFLRVMASVQQNLAPYRPASLSRTEMALLFIGSLFLTSPYQFREGTTPVMNASNPFVYAVVPGGVPVVYRYSPEAFPQSIRLEHDFKSGTYRQVMVRWEDLEKSMSRSFGGSPYRTEPVPKVQFHSTDKLAP